MPPKPRPLALELNYSCNIQCSRGSGLAPMRVPARAGAAGTAARLRLKARESTGQGCRRPQGGAQACTAARLPPFKQHVHPHGPQLHIVSVPRRGPLRPARGACCGGVPMLRYAWPHAASNPIPPVGTRELGSWDSVPWGWCAGRGSGHGLHAAVRRGGPRCAGRHESGWSVCVLHARGWPSSELPPLHPHAGGLRRGAARGGS